MGAVVEKTFVWKFMDQISQGVANARQAMDEAVHAAASMGFKVSESGEKWHNYASKQKEAMDEAKANFNEYKNQVTNSSNSIREKISGLINRLKEIPHDVVTTLKSKINDENIGIFSRKVRDVPKERSVFLRARDKFTDMFRRLGERIKQIPKDRSLLLKVKDGFSNGFKKFNEGAKKTRENGHRLRDIIEGTFVGNALYSAYDKVKDGIVEATKAGYDFDKEQQVMMQTWTTLAGSASQAKGMVNTINDLSKKTGQASDLVNELEQGFYHLHSSKREADELSKAMLNMGDAVGLTGDQMKSVTQDMVHGLATGKVSAGELNQIGAYFPMIDEALSKHEHTTVAGMRNMARQGKITGKDLESVFTELGNHKYGEAADNMLKTMTGMQRTVKAQMPKLLGDIEEPMLKAQNPIFGTISKWVSETHTENLFKNLGDKVNKGFATVTKAFSGDNFTGKGFTNTLNQMVENAGKSVDKLSAWLAKNAGNIKAFGSIVKSSLTIAFKVLSSVIGDVVTVLGHLFNPLGKASDNSKTASKSVGSLASGLKALANNNGAIKTIAATLTTFLVAKKILTTAMALKQMNDTLHLTAGAGKLVSAAFSPWVLIPAIIIAIGVGLYELYKHNKKFRDFVNGIWKSVTSTFGKIGKYISNTFKGAGKWFSGLVKGAQKALNTVEKFFTGKLGWEKAISKEISNIIKTVSKGFKQVLKTIGNILKGFGKVLMYAFILPVGLAAIILKPFIKPFTKLIKATIKTVKNLWSKLVNFLRTVFTPVINTWKVVWKAISKFFHIVWEKMYSVVKVIFKAISEFIHLELKGISSIWHTIWNAISSFFGTIWRGMKALLLPIVEAIWNAIKDVLDSISKIWHSIWNSISNFFSNIWDGICKIAKTSTNWLSSHISDVLNSISTVWHSMWQGLSDFFSNIWKGIKQAAQDGINGVLSIINAGVDAINSVWKFFTGHKTGIRHLKPVKFAQGGVVHTRLSMVNDGAGQNWKELLQLPSGELKMTHQRNAVLPLPAGTRVYNGDETAAIMAYAGVDHYAHGGIVGDAIDWTKGKLSDIGSWIGDKLGAVKKFLKDPLGNISKLLHKATDGLFKGAASFGGLASGAIGKLSSIAVNKFKEMLNSTKKKLEESLGDLGHGGASYDPSLIKRAASAMRTSIDGEKLRQLQFLINNESGGRAGIRGIDDGDGTGPAMGLLQYKRSTFDTYALPGHRNILSAYDQLLAFFNDSNWYSDIGVGYNGKYGEWRGLASGPSGHRRFANGGEVFEEQSAIIGDNSQHHEFVINPYDVTAYPLLAKAMDTTMRAQPVSTQATNNYEDDNADIDRKLKMVIDLLGSINNKDFAPEINIAKTSSNLNQQNRRNTDIYAYQRGDRQ
ncbi:tape measure protein [Companilactobacillus alimentarius]